MKIRSWVLGLIVIVLIFGGIGVTSVTGDWQTTSNKKPAKYSTGEFTGQNNPADIRGSYSFGEISELFQIPLADLAKAFALGSDRGPSDFLCKDLESLYSGTGVGTSSVRLFVALYKGLPYTLSDSEFLFEPAVTLLKEKAKLTQEQVSFLDAHIAGQLIPPASIPAVSPNSAPQVTVTPTHTTLPGTITGKTTFQELLDWGISQKDIELVIDGNIPAKSMAVRDYASQKGLEFLSLKVELQALADALK